MQTNTQTMTRPWLMRWLQENDAAALEELYRQADEMRQQHVGSDVHLRGLIEFSNQCRRNCMYCGLRADNTELNRYCMSKAEILQCAREAEGFGYGTVVLQSGETDEIAADWLADVVGEIKKKHDLAVTLSVGERAIEDLQAWRDAGADRYLLRFETSDEKLYSKLHPRTDGTLKDRIAMLRTLRQLGYEVGSGVMVGSPRQTYRMLARDIETFRELDLDMIGVGPFIPHQGTPLGKLTPHAGSEEIVPATELMTYKVVALTRITCPLTNIPSTTALATLNKAQGRELGLCRGANVVMPNLTPPKYRLLYEIYPAKACINETAEACHGCMKQRIRSLGRTIAEGPGTSLNYARRHASPEHD